MAAYATSERFGDFGDGWLREADSHEGKKHR